MTFYFPPIKNSNQLWDSPDDIREERFNYYYIWWRKLWTVRQKFEEILTRQRRRSHHTKFPTTQPHKKLFFPQQTLFLFLPDSNDFFRRQNARNYFMTLSFCSCRDFLGVRRERIPSAGPFDPTAEKSDRGNRGNTGKDVFSGATGRLLTAALRKGRRMRTEIPGTVRSGVDLLMWVPGLFDRVFKISA